MDAIIKILIFLDDMNLNYESIYYTATIELLRNIRKIPNMTIYEVAEVCFVSPSTVSRLAKMLGYASFAELKVAISASVGEDIPSVRHTFVGDTKAPADHDPQSSIAQYLDRIVDTVQYVRNTMDEDVLMSAAHSLRAAKSIGIFFNDTSSIIGMQRMFFMEGKTALVRKGMNDQLKYAKSLSADDVIMMTIHNEREFAGKAQIMEEARARGVKVIVIASKKFPTEHQPVDHLFSFESNDILLANLFFGLYIRMFMIAYNRTAID